jgi:ankyrin repeat protein
LTELWLHRKTRPHWRITFSIARTKLGAAPKVESSLPAVHCPLYRSKEGKMKKIDRELVVATRANNVQEVQRILSVGADVNAKDNDGLTPLIVASVRGHVQVVHEFLKHGADIEAKEIHGGTALHCACANGHPAVVKALLSGGANIFSANNHGLNPIHCAVSKGRGGKSEVSKYLLQQLYATTSRLPLHKLLEDLTWSGDPDRSDVPPLWNALQRNVLFKNDVVEIMEYLVDRDPSLLDSREHDGSLPLHVACRRCASFTIVQFLVNRYKSSVKSVSSKGDLPLFLACEMPKTSLDTIFVLVKLYPDLVFR